MSRKGDCWDNVVVESFFATLKSERIHWRSYPDFRNSIQFQRNFAHWVLPNLLTFGS